MSPRHRPGTWPARHLRAPETAFLSALSRGRLHHAWLVCGPEGVGKATFAYRAARRLLGTASDSLAPFGLREDEAAGQLIVARAHPDFMVVERDVEGGKPRKSIPVDEVRDLPAFFAKSPSMSRYRVAIVDAVDDLNTNGANALLKTLEEPPERGVLFLVSHASGRLLPTIRSRCRKLDVAAWSEADLADLVQDEAGASREAATLAARMGRGSPGRALRMAGEGALAVERLAQDLVAGRAVSDADLLKVADGFRGGEGQARLDLFLDRLADALRDRVRTGLLSAEAGTSLWARVNEAGGEAEGLNLDKADVFWTLITAVRALAR